MKPKNIDEKAALAALEEVSKLCEQEYGLPLEGLLKEPGGEQRLQRLAGVLLKRPFADCVDRIGNYNPTGATSSWIWKPEKLNDPALENLDEHEVLEKIRVERGSKPWKSLVEIEHEAGLFYVLGTWAYGKLKDDDRSFIEHYRATRSPETNLAIKLVNLLPIVGTFAGIVGVPALAISLAFIAVEYGLDSLSKPETIPEPQRN